MVSDNTKESDIQQPATQQSNANVTMQQTVLISVVCSLLTILAYALLFQPLQAIQANKTEITLQKEQLTEVQESLKVSREELTKQMQGYINENYGDISKRDENIAKLIIYFKQHEARLSNIEEALAKF